MTKLRIASTLLLWILLSGFRLADGFREQFQKAYHNGDPAAVEKVLLEWEKATPQDPDLYVAQFNWLLKKAERLELKPGAPTGEAFIIKDKKGSLKGNISTGHDPELVTQAIAALTKGIVFGPDRLDMYYGQAKQYEEIGQPAQQVQTLRTALQARAQSGKPWRWRDGGALPAPEAEFVPGTLEEYANFYWQQEGEQGLKWGRAIAELMEEFYPKSSLGFFNMGIYYKLTNQAAKAYPKFQQADAIQPQDMYTLANLTQLAIALKHKQEATDYLARLREMPGGKEPAEALAKELKKP